MSPVPTTVVNSASEYHVVFPKGTLVTVRVLTSPVQIVLLGAVGAGGAAITLISTKVFTYSVSVQLHLFQFFR